MNQRLMLLRNIKRRLLLAVMVLGVAVALNLVVGQIASRLEAQATKIQADYISVKQRIDAGNATMKFVRETQPVYDQLNLTPGQPSIDALIAKSKFLVLQEAHAIDLSKDRSKNPEISTIVETTQETLKKNEAVAVTAKISLQELYVYSDETLIRFLKQMRADFGGVLEIKRCVFSTDDGAFAVALKQGKQPVVASVEAQWHGIKLIETPDSSVGGAP